MRRDKRAHVADTASYYALDWETASSDDSELVHSIVDMGPFNDGPTRPLEPSHKRLIIGSPDRSVARKYGVAALTAMLVVALLATPFLAGTGQGAGSPSAGATLDPASQAYLGTLRTYYGPLATANEPAKGCLNVVGLAQPEQRADLMTTCRPLMAAELAAARSLAKRLARARPPARWQAQGVALKQATLALVDLLTGQLQDIDAGDVDRFVGTEDWATSTLTLFLDPITQINREIGAGPPPLPAPLPLMGTDFT